MESKIYASQNVFMIHYTRNLILFATNAVRGKNFSRNCSELRQMLDQNSSLLTRPLLAFSVVIQEADNLWVTFMFLFQC